MGMKGEEGRGWFDLVKGCPFAHILRSHEIDEDPFEQVSRVPLLG
jgi:hypothetical protein